MQILAKADGYQITFHPAADVPSKTIVITFGGQPSDISDKGFGTGFALSMGWDTIYVAQKLGTQFQDLSLETFVEAVAPFVSTWDDVVCYGSSLGAYAALYYGGSLGARILTGAPMFPGWPALKLRPYADLNVTHKELWEVPVSPVPPVVIYDPHYPNDHFLIENMVRRAYPDGQFVHVPHGGHTVLITLAQARLLKPIVLSFVNDKELMTFTPPGEGTAIFHGERGAQLIRTDPETARDDLARSLELEPSRRVFNRYIQVLLRLGDLETAQAAIDKGRETGDKAFELFPPRAKAAQEAGLRV